MTPGQCISDPGSVLPRIPGESVPSWGVRALRAAGLLPGPDDIVVSREALAHVFHRLTDGELEDAQHCPQCRSLLAALSQPHPKETP